MNKFIIAIDGPAASGKGTLSKALADKLDYTYFGTGLIYRAAAKFIISNDIDCNIEEKVSKSLADIDIENLDYDNLDSEYIASIASIIAAYPQVRNIVTYMQRKYIEESKKSMIVEGRDIGSVVYTEANLKFFLTASVEIRADRRYKELQDKGIDIIYDDILAELTKRDERDRSRLISPLVKADDAIEIDSGNMDKKQLLNFCLSIVRNRFKLTK